LEITRPRTLCAGPRPRGEFWPVWLDRFSISRWTRCALTNGGGAGHVVVDIRLAEQRRDGVLLLRGDECGPGPDTRNGVNDQGGRASATAGGGQTCPQEADRSRAGSTQARSPVQLGQSIGFDVRHVGHLPPEWLRRSTGTKVDRKEDRKAEAGAEGRVTRKGSSNGRAAPKERFPARVAGPEGHGPEELSLVRGVVPMERVPEEASPVRGAGLKGSASAGRSPAREARQRSLGDPLRKR